MDKPKHVPETQRPVNVAGKIFGQMFLNKHMAGLRKILNTANWVKPVSPNAWHGTTFFPPNKRNSTRECARRLRQSVGYQRRVKEHTRYDDPK